MSKCLIIGANGFIGSHLVDQLTAEGHQVTAFDRFSSGNTLYETANVRRIIGDFANIANLRDAVTGQDRIFHMLSATSPITAEDDPSLDIRSNVAQTVNLLGICADAGVERFYFASTGGAIYGPQGPQSFEETDAVMPVSPYAIGKLAIENYLRYFKVKHGLKSVAFRISNPYGTRQHPNRLQGLIPIAARQIVAGYAVVRYGDGSMIRDYVYVKDLVRMIAQTVESEPEYDVYNLGSGHGHSVTAVLDCLAEVAGRDLHIRELPVPPTFVQHVVLNTSRFQSEFGAIELTPLEIGAREVVREALHSLPAPA